MNNLLYIIAVICVIGWILGFSFGSVGSLIHILLVLAVVGIVYRLLTGRRSEL